MLSWLTNLWSKLRRSSPNTVSKMSTEVRMTDLDNPSSVWIPMSDERYHHRSLRRQLSRKLSSRAKQFGCNTTACTIAVCFIVAILALFVSSFTLYLYIQMHGLGPQVEIVQEVLHSQSSSQHGHNPPSLPTQVFAGLATAMPSQSRQMHEEPHAEAVKSYAHIVGVDQGSRPGNDAALGYINAWKANVTHNVNFVANSYIEIVEAGFYYVYTQIYFCDSQTDSSNPSMRSSTNRNRIPLMESVLPDKEFATKYHGGVFHLDKGDKITVSVSSNVHRIYTASEKTFFGVFLLSSTSLMSADHGGAAPS